MSTIIQLYQFDQVTENANICV